MILLGTVAGGTFSGFIVEKGNWPVQFWYNVGLEAFIAISCVLFLDETAYPRDGNMDQPLLPSNPLQRKLATYALTQRVTPHRTAAQLSYLAISPFLIGLSPVGILVGFFLFVMFGWAVAVNTELSVYLQTPVSKGGYGFTPYQNAYCKWINLQLDLHPELI